MNKRGALVIAAALAAYLNSLSGPFQFDDYNVIVDNPAVQSWTAFYADIRGGLRPLLKLTYTLNWTSGGGPFGFHLFNAALHALNSVLVYLLALRFAGRRHEIASAGAGGGDRVGGGSGWALLPPLLFALHPVQTEAVTYISGRSASLMALFYLLSVLAYIEGSVFKRRLWVHIVSPALFLMAAAAKETALTLPAALLLWDYCSGKDRLRDSLKRLSIHWALFLASAFALLAHPGYRRLIAYSIVSRPLLTNLLSQINGVFYLITRLVSVNGQNIDPDLPVLNSMDAGLLLKFTALLALLSAGAWCLKRRPWTGLGIFWFFLHLVPTNSVVPRLDIANERHLYLANAGLFMAAGFEIERLCRFIRLEGRLARVPAAALLASLFLFTVLRNHAYRSETSLWEDTAGKSPAKARVYNNLGYAYGLEGRVEESRKAYLTAIRLDPGFTRARNNLDLVDVLSGG